MVRNRRPYIVDIFCRYKIELPFSEQYVKITYKCCKGVAVRMFLRNNLGEQPDRQDTVLGGYPALKIQLYCLLAAGVTELLFLVLGSLLGYIMYYYVESYLLIPCVLFIGTILTQGIPRQAGRQLALGMGMVAWFVITQSQHKMQGMDTQYIGMFFCTYLLAFPFASVTQDGVRQKGLKLIAWCYVAVSMVLVIYSILLLLDLLPSFLEPYIVWDGARLQAMWHSNICACLFMIGIAICFGFFFQAKKVWQKCLLLASAALQFGCMALTNCRTSILMTCALIGGIAFFAIKKNGWKRFAVGFVSALTIMVALFAVSSTLYKMNNERLIAKYTEQAASIEENATDIEADGADAVETKVLQPVVNAQGQLQGANGQSSLSNDLRTLNGRTIIWTSALKALRDNSNLLIWGTEYVGVVISAYNPFEVVHAHNSWAESLFRMGLPGFVFVLVFTGIAIWDALRLLWKNNDMWKTCIALLVLCVLVAGFLEPFLFSADISYHYLDFIFFLCVGYMTQWCGENGKNNSTLI